MALKKKHGQIPLHTGDPSPRSKVQISSDTSHHKELGIDLPFSNIHCSALKRTFLISAIFFRKNINPYEVEKCLKEHPAVLDSAMVSSPHLMGQVRHNRKLTTFLCWAEH